jgi:hypothetical protein
MEEESENEQYGSNSEHSSEDETEAESEKDEYTVNGFCRDIADRSLAAAERSVAVKPNSKPVRLCIVRGRHEGAHFTGPIIWNQDDLVSRRMMYDDQPFTIDRFKKGAQTGCETCGFVCAVLEACLGLPVEQLAGRVEFNPGYYKMKWTYDGGETVEIEFFALSCKSLQFSWRMFHSLGYYGRSYGCWAAVNTSRKTLQYICRCASKY